MKRLLIILTTAILLLSLSSCNIIKEVVRRTVTIRDPDIVDTNPYRKIEPKELTYSEGYTPVICDYSYKALPLEGEKQLYDKLDEVCLDISPEYSEEAQRYPMPEIRLEGVSLTEAQVRTTLKALNDDRPDFFWSCGTVGYYSNPELTIVQLYSVYSPDEVSERLAALHDAADAFFATVPDGLSEYERECMVHDYLLDRIEYDTEINRDDTSNNPLEIFTAYGALVDKKAVCEGYARAFQLLMNGLGVDCVDITGYSSDELHMWNEVKLDGEWYATDVTWDDREESYAHWCFFDLTTSQMAEDHTTAPMFYDLTDDQINGEYEDINADIMNLFVPECTDTSMNRYEIECANLDDYEGAEVKNALLQAARDFKEYFVFYIGEDLDYDEAVSLLFRDYPQHFFSYVGSVNWYLEGYSIDSSNVGYICLDRNRAVAVQLNYY